MRVLLVEDNPIDAQALSDLLAGHADEDVVVHRVSRLSDLDAPLDERPDVVLLDLSLPDARGAESVRGVRARVDDVPIVVMTADADASKPIEMLREGAEDYIVKGHHDGDALLRAMRYARERHELKRRLAHADRLAAVGQLAAGVAHEVSNPASVVLANTTRMQTLLAEMAARGARETAESPSLALASSECSRMLEDNRAALERIRSVVRDLQGYARIERNQVERVALAELVERTCNLVAATIRHGATIERNLRPVPEIAADRAKLEQLLTNLLVNAAHALEMTTDGRARRIAVSTAQVGDAILLSVEDNGCGMTEEVQQRVFEPFFTTKDVDRGTGLGMAIATDIARHHRGRIECDSQIGRGTRFDVWLPIHNGFLLPKRADPESGRPAGRTRVLLIDDEPQVAAIYGELLATQHEVVIAHGGREADAVLSRDQGFDVIVCDLMMPDLNGIELYERVLERMPELARRFIFCSGGLVTQQSRDFARRISNPLLYKPTSLQDMLQAIDRVVLAELRPAARDAAPRT